MTQAEETFYGIADHLNKTDEVAKGNMFGAKCLKTGKKAFAMFYKGEMVFKLPPEQTLSELEGVLPFEPSPGKRMNGWLLVPHRHSERWEKLSETALDYVRRLPG